ncbi:hypothetical protein [Numidum massiliense]|uniref:hypothetical protein n=1 Tax=Numidum massiliense TaxID=1522315 RepID=UPI0012FC1CCB|nr:hypothetical protein [Numidum massiliense]
MMLRIGPFCVTISRHCLKAAELHRAWKKERLLKQIAIERGRELEERLHYYL